MTSFFFAGHNNFGNRGCEALVRSVSALVRERYVDAQFITPSVAIDLDRNQWVDSEIAGIRFVEAASFPERLKWWNRVRRVLPAIEKLGRPSYKLPTHLEKAMEFCDAVIMTGGDNISLDYDLPSLYEHAGYIDNAKKLGKRTFMWGASVGPFSRIPHVENLMRSHLNDYDGITVRESETARYLKSIGVDRVAEVADPAFTLRPEAFNLDGMLPDAPEGVVGINVSPLVRGYRNDESSRVALDKDVAEFARELAEKRGYGIVFLPHVGPLDGAPRNSDHHYMHGLIEKYQLQHPNIRLAPGNLNAAQLKFLLSKFRYFIGARTHATIGAISMGVPTISIAYSVKAKGINKDIFGDTRLVLDTPMVHRETLSESLALLEREEEQIHAHLAKTIPILRRRAALPVDILAGLI